MTWRSPDRQDRQVAALWAVCAGLALAFRPVWLAVAAFMPPCLWHEWTGWPCPGCGTTRAMLRLLHADPAGAIALNPLAAGTAVAFVAGGLLAPIWLACGGKRPYVAAHQRHAFLAALSAAFLANWSWLAFLGV